MFEGILNMSLALKISWLVSGDAKIGFKSINYLVPGVH